MCAEHGIYIGPSTFEYENEAHNLLWTAPDDLALLAAIKRFKRESRMSRERSEDAVSWNVFRGLERSGKLRTWLASQLGYDVREPRLHFWSYDEASEGTWPPLVRARKAFSEDAGRGSEPDLIIEADDVDVWVEAKFGSNNDTRPSDLDGARKRYCAGGNRWYDSVCKQRQDFDFIADALRRYELLRLWLLGSQQASVRSKRFVLINLVREGQALDIEGFAQEAFKQDEDRRVLRATWEGVASMLDSASDEPTRELRGYLQTKTIGYDSKGRLVKAFMV